MDGGSADIAVLGLAVMGRNLAMNIADHGFTVVAANRTVARVEEFLAGDAKGNDKILGAESFEHMMTLLAKPRRVMLMIRAGPAVDATIDTLVPLMEEGDIIIDGGNSNYHDTQRRCDALAAKGILFVGCGVSGGEEGARYGPSMMPGGAAGAWPHVGPILQAISAKVDGEDCCDWVGNGGAGHFVKMVHNGIEYGDMQLICEAFTLMRQGLGLTVDEISELFDEWNQGELESFLVEITRDVLAYKDTDGTTPLVDMILDTAGQKGTGKWTSVAALEYGVPLTLITESVFARFISSFKDERVAASKVLQGPTVAPVDVAERTQWINKIRNALYAAKLISYAQGFRLLKAGSEEHGWELNYGAIALMWRGGCIIRSAFLGDIRDAYTADPGLSHLLFSEYFQEAVNTREQQWREVVAFGVMRGVPMPSFSSALAYYDSFRSETLPANLIQGLRDYFGAHTYQRIDNIGTHVHTNWTGTGGSVSSTTYQA